MKALPHCRHGCNGRVMLIRDGGRSIIFIYPFQNCAYTAQLCENVYMRE